MAFHDSNSECEEIAMFKMSSSDEDLSESYIDIDIQIDMFASLIEDMKNHLGNQVDCFAMERYFLLLNQIRLVKEQLKGVSISLNNIQICGKECNLLEMIPGVVCCESKCILNDAINRFENVKLVLEFNLERIQKQLDKEFRKFKLAGKPTTDL